jgi:hypothetical protein
MRKGTYSLVACFWIAHDWVGVFGGVSNVTSCWNYEPNAAEARPKMDKEQKRDTLGIENYDLA